jgi:RNA polymerase sigma-70 factor (ECF subfamily)
MDGELAPDQRATVEAHLARCPTCPPLYASLVGIQSAMGGLRDPDSVVEDEIGKRILDQLRK